MIHPPESPVPIIVAHQLRELGVLGRGQNGTVLKALHLPRSVLPLSIRTHTAWRTRTLAWTGPPLLTPPRPARAPASLSFVALKAMNGYDQGTRSILPEKRSHRFPSCSHTQPAYKITVSMNGVGGEPGAGWGKRIDFHGDPIGTSS